MRGKISAGASALLLSAMVAGDALAEDVHVATTAIVEHPALDAARDGVRDELKEAGYEVGKNLTFTYESAQGNPGTAAQIARKLVGDEPSVIGTITLGLSPTNLRAICAAVPGLPWALS